MRDLIRLLVRSGGDLVTQSQWVEEVRQGRIVSENAISASIASGQKTIGDDGKSQSEPKNAVWDELIENLVDFLEQGTSPLAVGMATGCFYVSIFGLLPAWLLLPRCDAAAPRPVAPYMNRWLGET